MIIAYHDNVINYYVLALTIIKGYSPELSFDLIETGQLKSFDEDAEYLLELRESGITYSEIGRIYERNPATIFRRIERLRKKKEELKKCAERC